MPRLSELADGRSARVVEVETAREPALAQRILEMGLTPGVLVKRMGAAPLGDPIAFEVRGYRLSLRRAEAALVVVEEA